MLNLKRKKLKYQKGQSLVEHLILWPALVFVVLFALQLGQLYTAKATVNAASLRAAREGALRYGDISHMNRIFVEGLAPLYLRKDPNAINYTKAVGKSYTENFVTPNGKRLLGSGILIEVISPNQQIFNAFSENQYTLPADCEKKTTTSRHNHWPKTSCREPSRPTRQIPNDNLNVRNPSTKRVSVSGQNVDMNIQDANLLKIRAHYCVPLTIPVMRSAFYHTTVNLRQMWNRDWYSFFQTTAASRHPAYRTCIVRTQKDAVARSLSRTSRKYYIPVSADAVVRMQTPYRN